MNHECTCPPFVGGRVMTASLGPEVVEASPCAHRGLWQTPRFIASLTDEFESSRVMFNFLDLSAGIHSIISVRLPGVSHDVQDPRSNPEAPPAFPPFLRAARKRLKMARGCVCIAQQWGQGRTAWWKMWQRVELWQVWGWNSPNSPWFRWWGCQMMLDRGWHTINKLCWFYLQFARKSPNRSSFPLPNWDFRTAQGLPRSCEVIGSARTVRMFDAILSCISRV